MKGFETPFWLIALIVIGILVGTGTLFSVVGGGMTVLSIGTSSVITPSTNADNVEWLVTVATTGASQSIVGTVTPDQFQTSTGFATEYPLELTIDAIEEKVRYDINNDKVPVWKYSLLQTTSYPITGPKTCKDQFGTQADWEIEVRGDLFQEVKARFCVYRTQIAVKGSLDSPDITFNAKMTMKNNQELLTATISNTETSAVFNSASRGVIGRVSWVGSLVTGDSPPPSSSYIPVYDFQDLWHLVSLNKWNSYITRESTTEQSLSEKAVQFKVSDCTAGDIKNCEVVLQNILQPANVAADDVVNSRASIPGQSTIDGINDEDATSSAVLVDLKQRITIQQLTYRIKASWLGIRISYGEPKIISASAPTFKSGEPGNIIIEVKNVGGAKGTFEATLQSCGKFKQEASAYSTQVQLSAGQSGTVSIPISPLDLGTATTDTCTIKVYDKDEPTNFDTRQVTIHMEQAAACDEGKITFSGSKILKCVGGKYITIEECGVNEKVSVDALGNPYCESVKPGGDDEGGCGFLGINCLFSGLKTAAIILIVILILILAIIIFKN